MRLRVLFVDYGGEGEMPNAMAITDEYMEDSWNGIPEFYSQASEALEKGGGRVVEAFIEVPDPAVLNLFRTRTLPGSITHA